MIKAVIVEDNFEIRNEFKEQLLEIEPSINIVVEEGTKNDIGFVDNCVKLIDDEKPDIVFLDFTLRGGNAINVLDKVSFKKFYFIIITGAYENNQPHKIHISPHKDRLISYLEKPIKSDMLAEATKMCLKKIQEKIVEIQFPNKTIRLKISDIVLCREIEGGFLGKKVEIQYKENGNFKSKSFSGSLKSFKEKINASLTYFFDTERECFLNKQFVANYDDDTVTMANKEKIRLTTNKFREFQSWWNNENIK
jgi:DNA-binding LytR/AlgR family response regulator